MIFGRVAMSCTFCVFLVSFVFSITIDTRYGISWNNENARMKNYNVMSCSHKMHFMYGFPQGPFDTSPLINPFITIHKLQKFQ